MFTMQNTGMTTRLLALMEETMEMLAFVSSHCELDETASKAWEDIQARFINKVSKNVSQVARLSSHGFNDSLYHRRKAILDSMSKSRSTLAVKRLQSLPPSAQYLFGDDISKIKDSLQMTATLKKDGREFKVDTCLLIIWYK